MFAVNKSHGHLVLKSGYVQISRGSYAKVTQEDLDTADFKDAIAKGWLEVTDKEPVDKAVPGLTVENIAKQEVGLSAEDLKAELARREADTAPVAVATALGRGEVDGLNTKSDEAAASAAEETPAEEAEEAKPKAKKAAK